MIVDNIWFHNGIGESLPRKDKLTAFLYDNGEVVVRSWFAYYTLPKLGNKIIETFVIGENGYYGKFAPTWVKIWIDEYNKTVTKPEYNK